MQLASQPVSEQLMQHAVVVTLPFARDPGPKLTCYKELLAPGSCCEFLGSAMGDVYMPDDLEGEEALRELEMSEIAAHRQATTSPPESFPLVALDEGNVRDDIEGEEALRELEMLDTFSYEQAATPVAETIDADHMPGDLEGEVVARGLDLPEAVARQQAAPSSPGSLPMMEAHAQQTPQNTVTPEALRAGLAVLLPTVGSSTTLGQVRQALAKHLGLPENALDCQAEEIWELTKEVLNAPQAPSPGADAVMTNSIAGEPPEIPKKLWKRQHSGTWSHTEDPNKKAPRDMAKGAFGELLLRVLADVFQKATHPPKRAKLNRVVKLSVWQEPHRNGMPHYHFPILAEHPWSVVSVKRALRAEGIFVEFSSDHDYYWTSFIYVATPDPMPQGKQEAELDQDPWLSPGHKSVRETLEDMPRGARASDKARVRRYLSDGEPAASQSKDISFTDKQFSAHVISKSLRSCTDLLAWVESHTSKLKSLPVDARSVVRGLEAYCYKHQQDLHRRIAFAWEMHDAPQKAALQQKSAWDMVIDASQHAPCVCQGAWVGLTETLLKLQCACFPAHASASEQPDSKSLREAIRRALREGCKKHTNVFLHGPNTSGKSHVLKPLAEILDGCTFLRPVGKGNYPLQGIFGAKACVLQDVRVTSFKLDFDSLLIWFEGEKFPVPLPRNRHDKDRYYDERAPVFVSSSSKFRIPQAEAQHLRVNEEEQNRMMDARFVYFHFPRSLTKVEKVEVAPCARCFAQWVCSDTSAGCAASGLGSLAAGPQAPAIARAALPCGASPHDAAEAILDWIETHGGELRLSGQAANLGALADALSWGQRFLPSCGRLLAFLRRYGSVKPTDPQVIVGVTFTPA